MASPVNGQVSLPPGYQLNPPTPPPGYVLDSPRTQIALPNQILQEVLTENKGIAKNFNNKNTVVVFADPKRSQYGLKNNGDLEFWPKSETGTTEFPSPDPTKNVLEIYSNDLKNNPIALKQALYGDLMHGMSNDPYWKSLRTNFMKNFTPEESKRQEQKQTWWDDVNSASSEDKFGPTYDAYIRGWIGNEGEGKQGQTQFGNTMYSPTQIQLLQKMQDYLKSGENPDDSEKSVSPALPDSQ